MIAHNNIDSFFIFNLLKYDRIFGKNLEHDTYKSKIKSLTQYFAAGGSVPGLAPETYVSFLFLWHI